ncbi:hypothetical protein M427DRAFT_453854 [Gonapodya prolifera JEL478]|uniref:Ras-GEF domain-containing protein n=1 Tax=Gonapodya prolifera (strain JEL478) TaxID=1344416 RepID=A0A139ASW1_GONPJ|nr:hypothetical protein M427DRAFT_453854 [Gonapodya prolifera JEL478]|eukprot:KXS19585.1 hypothetical protein M427DRAFT_453854 [Gonapodya prolifera JEL478]
MFALLKQGTTAEEQKKIIRYGEACTSRLKVAIEAQTSPPSGVVGAGSPGLGMSPSPTSRAPSPLPTRAQIPSPIYAPPRSPSPNARPYPANDRSLRGATPPTYFTQADIPTPPQVTVQFHQSSQSVSNLPAQLPEEPFPDDPIPRIPSSSLLAKHKLAFEQLKKKNAEYDKLQQDQGRDQGQNAYQRMKIVHDDLVRLTAECKAMTELIQSSKDKTIPKDADDRKKVARAITLLFAPHFRHITPNAIAKYIFGDRAVELQSTGAKSPRSKTQGLPVSMDNEPDPSEALANVIHLTNFLTNIVQTSILMPRDRLPPLEGWVGVAEVLYKQGDVHSLHAILKGLLSPAILRLDETRDRVARRDRLTMMETWGNECGLPPSNRAALLRLCGQPLKDGGDNVWMVYRSQTLSSFKEKPTFVPILDAALDEMRGMGPEAWASSNAYRGAAASSMAALSVALQGMPEMIKSMGKRTKEDYEWNHWILTRSFATKAKIMELSKALEIDEPPRQPAPSPRSVTPPVNKLSYFGLGDSNNARTPLPITNQNAVSAVDEFPDVLPPIADGRNVTAELAYLFPNVRAHVLERNQAKSPTSSDGAWQNTGGDLRETTWENVGNDQFATSGVEGGQNDVWTYNPQGYDPDYQEERTEEEGGNSVFIFPDTASVLFDENDPPNFSVGDQLEEKSDVTIHSAVDTVDALFNNYTEESRRRRMQHAQEERDNDQSSSLQRLSTHGRAPYSGQK